MRRVTLYFLFFLGVSALHAKDDVKYVRAQFDETDYGVRGLNVWFTNEGSAATTETVKVSVKLSAGNTVKLEKQEKIPAHAGNMFEFKGIASDAMEASIEWRGKIVQTIKSKKGSLPPEKRVVRKVDAATAYSVAMGCGFAFGYVPGGTKEGSIWIADSALRADAAPGMVVGEKAKLRLFAGRLRAPWKIKDFSGRVYTRGTGKATIAKAPLPDSDDTEIIVNVESPGGGFANHGSYEVDSLSLEGPESGHWSEAFCGELPGLKSGETKLYAVPARQFMEEGAKYGYNIDTQDGASFGAYNSRDYPDSIMIKSTSASYATLWGGKELRNGWRYVAIDLMGILIQKAYLREGMKPGATKCGVKLRLLPDDTETQILVRTVYLLGPARDGDWKKALR